MAQRLDPGTKPVPLCGRYEIISTLGQGGYGLVYKVRDLRQLQANHFLAVKTFKDTSPDEMYPKDLLIELDILTRTHHPNVASASECYHDHQINLVMELADGDLSKYISRKMEGEWLAVDQLKLIQSLMCGLQYLHVNYIIHRDLKPPNILMYGEVPKIADFGAAAIGNRTLTYVGGSPMTTIWWRCPEMLAADVVDVEAGYSPEFEYGAEVDVWSLGLICYFVIKGSYLVTGDNPGEMLYYIAGILGRMAPTQREALRLKYSEEEVTTLEQLRERRPVASTIRALPPDVVDLLMSMLECDPTKRGKLPVLMQHPLFGRAQCETPWIEYPIVELEERPGYSQGTRAKIVGKLLNLRSAYSLTYETFFLAVDLLDRRLAGPGSRTSKLVGISAMVCLLVAGKILGEELSPGVAVLEAQAKYGLTITPQLLIEDEKELVRALNFHLYRPTVNLWIPMPVEQLAKCYVKHMVPSEVLCGESS